MANLKHVGRIINTGARVVVVFRTLPGESDQALVLPVNNLPDHKHDSIMELIESVPGQDAYEFGEVLFRNYFADGQNMLNSLRVENRLQKVPTDSVEMVPNNSQSVRLDNLNQQIAVQKNCTVDDLCNFVQGGTPDSTANKTTNNPVAESPVQTPAAESSQAENAALSDKDLAKSLRSQADALYKEAARMRREAEDLDPAPKKTTSKKKEEA